MAHFPWFHSWFRFEQISASFEVARSPSASLLTLRV